VEMSARFCSFYGLANCLSIVALCICILRGQESGKISSFAKNDLERLLSDIENFVKDNPYLCQYRGALCKQPNACCIDIQLLNEIDSSLFVIKARLIECLSQINFCCGGAEQIIDAEIDPFFARINNLICVLNDLIIVQQSNTNSFVDQINTELDANNNTTKQKLYSLNAAVLANYAALSAQITNEKQLIIEQQRLQKNELALVQSKLDVQIVTGCLELKEQLFTAIGQISQQSIALNNTIVRADEQLNSALYGARHAITNAFISGSAQLADLIEQQSCAFDTKIKKLFAKLSGQLTGQVSRSAVNSSIQTDMICQGISNIGRSQQRQSNVLIQKLVDIIALLGKLTDVTVERILVATSALTTQVNEQSSLLASTMSNSIPTLITQLVSCRSSLYNALCEQVLGLEIQMVESSDKACAKLQNFETDFCQFFEMQISKLNNNAIVSMADITGQLAVLDESLRTYKTYVSSRFSCVQQGVQSQICQKLSNLSTEELFNKNCILGQLVNADLQITGQLSNKISTISKNLTAENAAIQVGISNALLDVYNHLGQNFSTLNGVLVANSNALCAKLAAAQTVLAGDLNNSLAQLYTDLTNRNNIISQRITTLGLDSGLAVNGGLSTLSTSIFVQNQSLCNQLVNFLTEVTADNNAVMTKLSGIELAITTTLINTTQEVDNAITMIYAEVQNLLLTFAYTYSAILIYLLV